MRKESPYIVFVLDEPSILLISSAIKHDIRNSDNNIFKIVIFGVQLIPNAVIYENWTIIDGDHIELSQENKLFLAQRGHHLKAQAGGAICQLVVQNLQNPVNMKRKYRRGLSDLVFHGLLTAVSDPRKDGRPAGE